MKTRGRLKGLRTGTADERGMVLVAAILVTVLLSLLGATFLTASLTESTISYNQVNQARAFHVAEGGVSHARRFLSQAVATTGLNTLLAGSSGNPPTPVPVAGLQGFSAFGAGQGTYSVAVANNTAAYQAFPTDPDPAIDTDNRVWITAVGTYRNATQAVRALVEFSPLLNPPAALDTLNGFNPLLAVGFVFNGNAFQVTGLDTPAPVATGACGTPGPPKMGIVVESAPSLAELDAEIAPNQENNVTGAGGNNSIAQDTSIPLALLQALRAALIPQPALTLSGNVNGNIGSPTAPVTAYANDHLDLQGNGKGYGILVVERQLRMRGTFTWEGLILLVGQGEFEIEGTANVYGAVLAANTGAYSGNSGETRVRVGGDATVAFSSQALCRAAQLIPTTLLAWQQL